MTAPKGIRVVGYGRVSTDKQARDGISLEAQRNRCEAWATAQGATGFTWYVDEGKSGKSAGNRPGLQAALKDVCDNGGILVAFDLSRIGRSVQDLCQIAKRVQMRGADFATLTESIDTSSAAGKMIFHMLAAMAQFGSDLAHEKALELVGYKRERGEYLGGRVPYGFEVGEGKVLVDVPAEREVIDQMVALHQAGHGYREIARVGNDAGWPTRLGTQWSAKTVRDIIKRESGDGE